MDNFISSCSNNKNIYKFNENNINLFYRVWNNKFLNFMIWKMVREELRIYDFIKFNYEQLYDSRVLISYKLLQVLKEKVERNEFIYFPLKIKENFFYETRSFSEEFFKKLITNYRNQLLPQRKLFQYIIRGENVNALQVFLNEPSSNLLENENNEQQWEFMRDKSQLGDWAVNIGNLKILECLNRNNEKSVSMGQKLFDNLTNDHSTDEHIKDINKILDYLLDNNWIQLSDFKGTHLKIGYSLKMIGYFKLIDRIKEFITINKSKSIVFFDVLDQKSTFSKVTHIINIYKYLKRNESKPYDKSKEDFKEDHFNINPEMEIMGYKNKEEKQLSIEIIKEYINTAPNDLSKIPSYETSYFYNALIFSGQLDLAIEYFKITHTKNHTLFNYSIGFGDIEILEFCTSNNRFDFILYPTQSLFYYNSKIISTKEKIDYLSALFNISRNNGLVSNVYLNLISNNEIDCLKYLIKELKLLPTKLSFDQFVFHSLEVFKLVIDYFIGNSNNTPIIEFERLIVLLINSIKNSILNEMLEWVLNQKKVNGEYLIDRSNPIYIDSIEVLCRGDNIEMLKLLTDKGFTCTYNGIYKKVIELKAINYYRYLLEFRNEGVITSTTISSDNLMWKCRSCETENLETNKSCSSCMISNPIGATISNQETWYEAVHFFETKSNQIKNLSKRFPISSHPQIPNDQRFIYLISTNQKSKFIQLFSEHLSNTKQNYDIIQNEWEKLVKSEYFNYNSIDFFKSIFEELLKKRTISEASKYIDPLLTGLISCSNLPVIKYIHQTYLFLFKTNSTSSDHWIYTSIEFGCIDVFNYLIDICQLQPTEDKSFHLTLPECSKSSHFLFWMYYQFPSFKFSPLTKNEKSDDDIEVYKINWFFNNILINQQQHDEDDDDDSDNDNNENW